MLLVGTHIANDPLEISFFSPKRSGTEILIFIDLVAYEMYIDSNLQIQKEIDNPLKISKYCVVCVDSVSIRLGKRTKVLLGDLEL